MAGRKFSIVIGLDEPDQRLMEIRAAEAWLSDHPDTDDHPIFGEDPCYGQPHTTLADGGERGLLITDDGGYSNISQTASLVQWLLAKPGAPDYVFFEWSADDDEGYYGGCAYVTATGFVAHRTDHWFEQLRDELASQAQPPVTVPDDRRWDDDPVQFARFIAEGEAAGLFDPSVGTGQAGRAWRAMADSMDLPYVSDLEVIVERAQKRWEAYKAQPLQPAHYDAIAEAVTFRDDHFIWEPGECVDTDALIREVIEAHYGRTPAP